MPDDPPLLALLRWLDRRGYDFVSPTPATHQRLIAKRPVARDGDLRDVFGWSLPFDALEPELMALMESAGCLIRTDEGRYRSGLRASRVNGRLFLHSAFPTTQEDSVFLGPDSYRFADFILRNLRGPVSRLVDIGAGAGVGGIVAGLALPGVEVILTDLNSKALRLAAANASHAGVPVTLLECDGLEAAPAGVDLIVANPPFMADSEKRAYRDGGGTLGAELSVTWARQALTRLAPGGRMLLYSGAAIVDGRDGLEAALREIRGARVDYREIDPDIFGEEITRPGYEDVERIAAVGAVITRS